MTNWSGSGGAQGPPRPYQPGSSVPPPAYRPPGQWTPYAGTYQPMFVTARGGNGVAVAALVLGITSIVFSGWGAFDFAASCRLPPRRC